VQRDILELEVRVSKVHREQPVTKDILVQQELVVIKVRKEILEQQP
jgi:hypothetical protein